MDKLLDGTVVGDVIISASGEDDFIKTFVDSDGNVT